MSRISLKQLFLLSLVVLVSWQFGTGAQANQTRVAKPATATSAQTSLSPATASAFSPAVQQALEAGNTRQALQLCGRKCQGDPSGTLSAGQQGETHDYQCQNGNCACTSIPDCVKMTEVCAPGTTGCNDYGCTCAEKSGN